MSITSLLKPIFDSTAVISFIKRRLQKYNCVPDLQWTRQWVNVCNNLPTLDVIKGSSVVGSRKNSSLYLSLFI